eukprot:TRINITY_DN5058_c0_g1_i1.p2 TRINITY_DN5058_c0_g1~~TRINITY_DN5058_c0_g1_i1.p2  ORF type:complete len:338 (-),score=86.06 TRINITY_DN5058_c0_g1_i1:196-1209(-)
MKKMEQVKKLSQSQYPLNLKAPKPVARAIPSTKGMGKKNMSSMILMIQESTRGKALGARQSASRVRAGAGLRCVTPRVNPVNCSFAGKASAVNSSIAEVKAMSSREGPAENLKSTCDNSVYKALREQLHKITLKLDMEEYRPEDVESGQRQRRTREERSGRNLFLKGSASIQSDHKMDKTLPLQTHDSNSTAQPAKGEAIEKKTVVKRPLTRNQMNKPMKEYNFRKENLRAKASIESSYCTTRPPAKSLRKTESGISKKDPNKHAAKKYLLELYEKLIYQMKGVERNKKMQSTTKKLKGAVGRCMGSRNNLYSESNSKHSFQAQKSLYFNKTVKKLN